jgi:hypothetical protein
MMRVNLEQYVRRPQSKFTRYPLLLVDRGGFPSLSTLYAEPLG